MRLRLRLAVAFLLLSALPLAGLALYSYSSSSQALRRAAEAEAAIMARELETRVESVAAGVDERVKALARLPVEYWVGAPAEGALEREVLSDLASALPFIEGLRFEPAPAPAAPAATAPTAATPSTPAVAPVPPPASSAPPASTPDLAGLVEIALQLGPRFGGAQPTSPDQQAQLEAELMRVRTEVARAVTEAQKARALDARERALVAAKAGRVTSSREGRLERTAAATERRPALEGALREAAAPGAGKHAAQEKPLGKDLSCSVRAGDQVVGELKAKLRAKDLLKSVLAQTDRGQGEIPFALDDDNTLFVAQSTDGETLRNLPAIDALKAGAPAAPRQVEDEWVVVTREDPATGYRFGIAKPLSAPMAELKSATARNFAIGLALIGLAVIGMVPVSSGLVGNVRRLEEGATRIAQGDLTTRVPVRSRDEFGHLASTFNRMAEQLSEHQEKLLMQERRAKQQEIERALLAAENERRGRELEEARQFQLSLLPRELPRIPGFELGVSMTTATEVGGDYYDLQNAPDGDLLIAVGDATGHGAAAGTMVTAVKSLFMAGAAAAPPAEFLSQANGVVHRMGLYRMAMALAVARLSGRTLTLSSAGMPPALHFRAAEGVVAELALSGTPLGARADFPYAEARLELAPGDAVMLCSDGFTELPNGAGEPLGYERAAEAFARAAAGSAEEVVAALRAAAAGWTAGAAPCDDVTFLVLKAHA